MTCEARYCPECGDRLIHQSNRGPKESSSLFGQWVYDDVPHVFDFVDLDGLVWRRSTRVLYIVEEKHGNHGLSRSQQAVLPLLGRALALLIGDGAIDPRSRVLELHGEYNGEGMLERAIVQSLYPEPLPGPFPILTGAELASLFAGRRFLEGLP